MTLRTLSRTGLAALLASGVALGASAQAVSSASASESDAQAYVETTEQNDLFSIVEGRIAAQRAPTAALRAYAARSAEAHTQSTRMVEAAAKASGVAAPRPALSTGQRQLVRQLQAATAANFSEVFLEQHRDLNQQTITLQRAYAAGGSNAALRRVACRLADAAEDRVSQLQALEP